jgi:hypothetical protein
VLDPDVVVRADRAAVPAGASTEVRGASAVARRALAFSARARFAQLALVNGAVGVVVAPRGRLLVVLGFTVTRDKIVEIDVVADPGRLRQLDPGGVQRVTSQQARSGVIQSRSNARQSFSMPAAHRVVANALVEKPAFHRVAR